MQDGKGIFEIDQRGQDGVIALGIYLLESGFQHSEKIIPYLLQILKGLTNARWLDEVKIYKSESK